MISKKDLLDRIAALERREVTLNSYINERLAKVEKDAATKCSHSYDHKTASKNLNIPSIVFDVGLPNSYLKKKVIGDYEVCGICGVVNFQQTDFIEDSVRHQAIAKSKRKD